MGGGEALYRGDCMGAALRLERLGVRLGYARIGDTSNTAVESRKLKGEAAVLITRQSQGHLEDCLIRSTRLRFYPSLQGMGARSQCSDAGVVTLARCSEQEPG